MADPRGDHSDSGTLAVGEREVSHMLGTWRSPHLARRFDSLAIATALAAGVIGAAAGPNGVVARDGDMAGPTTVTSATTLASPSLAQLVGQKLMVSMSGTTPDSDLLGRISRGEVGGVILFGANV